MNEPQFYITIAMAPVMSLVIVIAGYIVQNSNLNARTAETRAEFNARLSTEIGAVRVEIAALRDVLRAELAAMRAEMDRDRKVTNAELTALRSETAKNHSELLTVLAQHEHQRISKP